VVPLPAQAAEVKRPSEAMDDIAGWRIKQRKAEQ